MEVEHIINLALTAVVTALIFSLSLVLNKLVRPSKAEESSDKGKDLLAEYGRAWCVQQTVPFADKLLGLSGAMDQRMLVPWEKGPADWFIRLPLILLCWVWPSPATLFMAHVANIVSWTTWMPAVWDHMCWAAILELCFVLAVLFGGSREKIMARFLPAYRAELILLYYSAAFWKLTTSWYSHYTSCAPVLLSELLSGLAPPEVLPAGSFAANLLLYIAPVFVAALEFAVPTAMLLCPRGGVLLALLFHQTINLMPMTYAAGFSLAMVTRLVVFVPGTLATALSKPSGGFLVPPLVVAAIAAIMVAVHRRLDCAGVAFLLLTLLYLRGMFISSPAAAKPEGGSSASMHVLRFLAVLIALVYGFLTPIIGVQAMASSTMYGNLKQFGGTNHLVVPTGLLQEHFASQTTGSWQANAFGGGMLRVDFTNSTVMQQLNPADATAQLPRQARALLKGINASGAYFELYAARNYFDRKEDHDATALHNRGAEGPRLGDPPYAAPAYELRRELALARARGERFKVVYTHLPFLGTVASYRDFTGPQVVLEEDSASGRRTCTVGGKPCADNEIALLPPPPGWLTWLLHPYPMPLLKDDLTEVHCTT